MNRKRLILLLGVFAIAFILWNPFRKKVVIHYAPDYYQRPGFGGEFYIKLSEDGTYHYYEGLLSSYIGIGKWTLEDDILTIYDADRIYRFRIKEDCLVYLKDQSAEFIYEHLNDGAEFTLKKDS